MMEQSIHVSRKLNQSIFFFNSVILICSFMVESLHGAISTTLPLVGVGCEEEECLDSYINTFM